MIGLLTPYAVQNYGTKLQAYAVQEIISQYDDVEIINFRPNFPERVRRKIEKRSFTKTYNDTKGISERDNISDELLEKRKSAISSFDRKLKIITQIYGFSNLRKKAGQYAAVVCGSDQIWNPVNLPEHIFMLEFVPDSVRRVAFAPSFGLPSIPDKMKTDYRKRLQHIEYMSVREKTGVKILEELGFKDVFWSLDPTLVLDETKWHEVADEGKVKIKEPYVFCYFLGSHTLGRDVARSISKSTGCKIVNLPHFKGYVEADQQFADYDLYDVSPQDFISLIRNASYVCTDSFHGTAFSIIFEKEFICCERHQNTDAGSTNDRIYSVLKLIGREDRLARNCDSVNQIIEDNINYKKVKAVIDENREQSRRFLTQALKGERNVGFR